MDQTCRWIAGIGGRCVLVFSLVSRAGRTEPAFIMSFVKSLTAFRRFRFRDPPPEFADPFVVKSLSRAHEDVVTTMPGIQPKSSGHLLEITDHVVGLLLRGAVVTRGGALDIYSVLVSAGKKEGFDSLLAFGARDRVRHDHRVQMTEMRQAVGVINGCGYVESHSGAR